MASAFRLEQSLTSRWVILGLLSDSQGIFGSTVTPDSDIENTFSGSVTATPFPSLPIHTGTGPSLTTLASSSSRQLTPFAHSQHLNQPNATSDYLLAQGISAVTSPNPSSWFREGASSSSVVLGKRPAQYDTGFAEPGLPKSNPWKKRKTSY
jgi:hypothetical protein